MSYVLMYNLVLLVSCERWSCKELDFCFRVVGIVEFLVLMGRFYRSV